MKEFKQLKFPNNVKGQGDKIRSLEVYSAEGWHVVSETITQGKFKGQNACCLYMICAPCAFLAGSSDGEINVTLSRELTEEIKKQRDADKAAAMVQQAKILQLKKGQWKVILLWIFVAYFSLATIVALFKSEFAIAVGYLIIAAILLPQTKKFLKDKYKFDLSTKIIIISVACILILLGIIGAMLSTK